MFDSVCIRPIRGGPSQVDLGLVAEALLFYQRVDIIADRSVFLTLLESLGTDGLLRLAESERVSLSYCNQFTGVVTEDARGPTERFFLGAVEMPHTAIDQLATEQFRIATGKSGRGRRLASKLLQHVDDVELDPSIPDSATADALDETYMAAIICDAIGFMAPEYRLPDRFAFEVQPVADGRIRLETNLDWAQINKHWRAATEAPIGATDVLSWILSAHEEMAFAAHVESEMITDPFTAHLVRRKTEALLAREQSAAGQQRFHNFVFDNARSVREAVNTGQRSLLDALDLAERGDRFRSWLSGLDADGAEDHLTQEYLRACTAETWADGLPTKSVRFLLVTGMSTAAGMALTGPVGIVAGPVIGAVDFLQDVMRRGWRPSQFVEGRLRGFLTSGDPAGP